MRDRGRRSRSRHRSPRSVPAPPPPRPATPPTPPELPPPRPGEGRDRGDRSPGSIAGDCDPPRPRHEHQPGAQARRRGHTPGPEQPAHAERPGHEGTDRDERDRRSSAAEAEELDDGRGGHVRAQHLGRPETGGIPPPGVGAERRQRRIRRREAEPDDRQPLRPNLTGGDEREHDHEEPDEEPRVADPLLAGLDGLGKAGQDTLGEARPNPLGRLVPERTKPRRAVHLVPEQLLIPDFSPPPRLEPRLECRGEMGDVPQPGGEHTGKDEPASEQPEHALGDADEESNGERPEERERRIGLDHRPRLAGPLPPAWSGGGALISHDARRHYDDTPPAQSHPLS